MLRGGSGTLRTDLHRATGTPSPAPSPTAQRRSPGAASSKRRRGSPSLGTPSVRPGRAVRAFASPPAAGWKRASPLPLPRCAGGGPPARPAFVLLPLAGPASLVSDKTTRHSHTDSAHLERPWDGLVWLLRGGSLRGFLYCLLSPETKPGPKPGSPVCCLPRAPKCPRY